MTKPAYAPPTVRRIAPGALNPQRHGRAPVLEAIDGVAVTDLLAAHGSPLFVFSEADLRAKARALREAFTSRYPEVVFAWSYGVLCAVALVPLAVLVVAVASPACRVHSNTRSI